MTEEPLDEAQKEESPPLYFIDTQWLKENDRSFFQLTWNRLCPDSQKKVTKRSKKGKEEILFETISSCCSKVADFIPPGLPIMEACFRLFLCGKNKPLSPEEMLESLKERWMELNYSPPIQPSALIRVLDADRYYGFRRWISDAQDELSREGPT